MALDPGEVLLPKQPGNTQANLHSSFPRALRTLRLGRARTVYVSTLGKFHPEGDFALSFGGDERNSAQLE